MTGLRLEGEGRGKAAWLRIRIKRFQRTESKKRERLALDREMWVATCDLKEI